MMCGRFYWMIWDSFGGQILVLVYLLLYYSVGFVLIINRLVK